MPAIRRFEDARKSRHGMGEKDVSFDVGLCLGLGQERWLVLLRLPKRAKGRWGTNMALHLQGSAYALLRSPPNYSPGSCRSCFGFWVSSTGLKLRQYMDITRHRRSYILMLHPRRMALRASRSHLSYLKQVGTFSNSQQHRRLSLSSRVRLHLRGNGSQHSLHSAAAYLRGRLWMRTQHAQGCHAVGNMEHGASKVPVSGC